MNQWRKASFFRVYILCSAENIAGYNILLLSNIANYPKYCIFCLSFSFFPPGQSSNKSVLILSGEEYCLRTLLSLQLIMTIIYYISKHLYGIELPYIIGEVDVIG